MTVVYVIEYLNANVTRGRLRITDNVGLDYLRSKLCLSTRSSISNAGPGSAASLKANLLDSAEIKYRIRYSRHSRGLLGQGNAVRVGRN